MQFPSQEENETDIQEDQRQTRSCHEEAGLTVTNINDVDVPSFQLLTPQLLQQPRPRPVKKSRARGMKTYHMSAFIQDLEIQGGC